MSRDLGIISLTVSAAIFVRLALPRGLSRRALRDWWFARRAADGDYRKKVGLR